MGAKYTCSLSNIFRIINRIVSFYEEAKEIQVILQCNEYEKFDLTVFCHSTIITIS